MSDKKQVLIIGGVAAGPKTASRITRQCPTAEVTIIERGEFLSYAGCGLPYYVSGVVSEQRELLETPAGALRDASFFKKVKNVHVRNHTEALEIDRQNKKVKVRDKTNENESWLDYDKLVLATGAVPVVPPIQGIGLENIFSLHGVHDAEGIRSVLAQDMAHDVVVIGGGLIGVEVTEALVSKGCRVTTVEFLPQILNMLDWEMAKTVEMHMEAKGVKVLTETRVHRIEGDESVQKVITDQGEIPADMVILGTGVRPNVELAAKAGLKIGTTGGIQVDKGMRTSDPDILAAGDCVESINIVTGKPCYVPLGSTANKQGRVAAASICGGKDEFPGVLGSAICKVFDYSVGITGLSEKTARAEGFDVLTVLAPAPDKAHYMPGMKPVFLKLVVDRKTRKLLGVQGTGPGDVDKRIDVAATAITCGMTVDMLANVDLSYAPPYSSAMDNIITAANVARNKLDGLMDGITPIEVKQMLDEGRDFILLDVRSPKEVRQMSIPEAVTIPLGGLRERMGELDKNKQVVAFCKISLRGYEAALILKAAGFEDVKVMDGGILMYPWRV